MKKQLDFFEQKVMLFIKIFTRILDLNLDDFGWCFFSDLDDVVITEKETPGCFFSREEIELINKTIDDEELELEPLPSVVINDRFIFSSDAQLMGIIAHEMRHLWQYFQTDYTELFKEHLIHKSDKYFESKRENDAYAFQEAMIEILFPTTSIKEIYVNFPNIKETVEHYKEMYKDKIISVLKELKIYKIQ